MAKFVDVPIDSPKNHQLNSQQLKFHYPKSKWNFPKIEAPYKKLLDFGQNKLTFPTVHRIIITNFSLIPFIVVFYYFSSPSFSNNSVKASFSEKAFS